MRTLGSAFVVRIQQTTIQCQREVSAIGLFLDWLQSLKQIFIIVSYHILVASLTLMALF